MSRPSDVQGQRMMEERGARRKRVLPDNIVLGISLRGL